MANDYPVRTGIYTFVLPAFSVFQLVNGLVNGGSLAFIGVYSVLALVCSTLLAQYQVILYRRKELTGRLP
jgi:predicted permease